MRDGGSAIRGRRPQKSLPPGGLFSRGGPAGANRPFFRRRVLVDPVAFLYNRAQEQGGGAMKLIHLSDLHLGKRVNGFSMLEDQRYILAEILDIVDRERPEAVLIAGDVYDKPVPPPRR